MYNLLNIICAGKNWKQYENVNWCSYYGKQYGGPLKKNLAIYNNVDEPRGHYPK